MSTVDNFVLSKYTSMGFTDVEADGDYVRINRSSQRPVRFGVVKLLDVTATDIAHLFVGDIDFVINIPTAGIFHRDAIKLCLDEHVAWGGLGDSMRAANLDDPQMYVRPNHDFVLRGLRQHSHVKSVSYLDSRRLVVTRTRGLPSLVLYIEDTYQAEVASVRNAIDRCSPFDIFVTTDPNSGPTKQAIATAEAAGLEILRWGKTLSRLRR